MSVTNKLLKRLVGLLFFFSISFNTVHIGPSGLGINATRILIVAIFIVYLFSLFKDRGEIKVPSTEWMFTFSMICIWIIYGFIISLVMSLDKTISMRYLWQLLTLLVVFLALSKLIEENHEIIITCMRGFIAGVIVNNIIGWYELFTSDYRFVLDISQVPYYARHNYALTFYANPNNLCTVLVFGCLFCIAALDIKTNKKIRIVCYGTIISSVAIMIRDFSESNVIGLAVGIALYYVMKSRRNKELTIKKIVIISIVLLAFLICLPKTISFLSTYLKQTIASFYISDSTVGNRLELSYSAISNMLKKNIFGVGLGNAKYYSDNIGGVGNVHNWFTEVFVDTGIVFFIIYILNYCLVIIRAYRISVSFHDHNRATICRIVFCTMIAFLVFNISSSSLFPSEYMWCIWAMFFAFVESKGGKENNTLLIVR